MSERFSTAILFLLGLTGCSPHWQADLPFGQTALPIDAGVPLANPIFVPAGDYEFVWNQTVDTLDDYFKIQHEERMQLIGGVVTEGRIETAPAAGATWFEPWRQDSTPGYEKLHATLQSIRRRASVRMLPVANGYSVEVAVYKELEDLNRAEHSTIGASTLRHDGSLVRGPMGTRDAPITLGWISLGRDVSLEQRILQDLQSRLAVPAGLGPLPPGNLMGP